MEEREDDGIGIPLQIGNKNEIHSACSRNDIGRLNRIIQSNIKVIDTQDEAVRKKFKYSDGLESSL